MNVFNALLRSFQPLAYTCLSNILPFENERQEKKPKHVIKHFVSDFMRARRACFCIVISSSICRNYLLWLITFILHVIRIVFKRQRRRLPTTNSNQLHIEIMAKYTFYRYSWWNVLWNRITTAYIHKTRNSHQIKHFYWTIVHAVAKISSNENWIECQKESKKKHISSTFF